MLKHFCSIDNGSMRYIEILFQKDVVLIVEIVSKLMQGWKKGCSGSKIELRNKRAEVEICEILACSGWVW